MSQPIATFRYNPGIVFGIVGLIVLVGLTAGLVYSAMTNTSQDNALGTLLSVESTTIMLWLTSLLFAVMIPFAIAMIVQSTKKPRQVVLTETHIIAPPHTFSKVTIEIAFSDIETLSVFSLRGRRILSLKHADGGLTIQDICVRPYAEFQRLVDTIEERLAAVRADL